MSFCKNLKILIAPPYIEKKEEKDPAQFRKRLHTSFILCMNAELNFISRENPDACIFDTLS